MPLQVLGRGSNGVVYKSLNMDTGDVVAIKQAICLLQFFLVVMLLMHFLLTTPATPPQDPEVGAGKHHG
jgi:hypothetical protein